MANSEVLEGGKRMSEGEKMIWAAVFAQQFSLSFDTGIGHVAAAKLASGFAWEAIYLGVVPLIKEEAEIPGGLRGPENALRRMLGLVKTEMGDWVKED